MKRIKLKFKGKNNTAYAIIHLHHVNSIFQLFTYLKMDETLFSSLQEPETEMDFSFHVVDRNDNYRWVAEFDNLNGNPETITGHLNGIAVTLNLIAVEILD